MNDTVQAIAGKLNQYESQGIILVNMNSTCKTT